MKCFSRMALSRLVHKASGITDSENIFPDLHLRATYRFVIHPYGSRNTLDKKHSDHFSKLIFKAAQSDRRICLNLINPDLFKRTCAQSQILLLIKFLILEPPFTEQYGRALK